ncbi:MAG: Gfo/Idh/MocA family oxidoreductase [Caldilineaceae bacterium]|nr:Gfo/Idh/MocA family oxidoreductase [Caldilineaceae bacterium]MDE0337973.1 Gfo/Idh/MocA family oxidoreductase [Caldilineaceae bacterium]
MANKIRIGVVGCRVGGAWVEGAHADSSTVAWAVADLNQDLARKVAQENDVARVYGDYRELLADDEVDAVGVATAPDVRKPMVLDALKAGKHVLVQKPHGRNAADVEEINAAAASSGKRLVYSYFMRHEEENKRSRALIADGRIGLPYHARVQYHYRERGVDYEPPAGREWLYRWGLKGGALGQHGSHYLDQAWYLLGSPEPQWAFAISHSAFPTRLKVERHSEDYMSFLVGCAGGITIQMDTSAVIATWADRAWDLRLRVLGTAGTVEVESTRLASGQTRSGTRRLLGAIYTEGDDFVEENAEHGSGDFDGEIRDFAAAIRGEQPPDVSPAEALTFMKLLDAIYLSAETGEKVQVAA